MPQPACMLACAVTLQTLLDNFVTEQAAAFLVLLRAKVRGRSVCACACPPAMTPCMALPAAPLKSLQMG